MNQGKCRSEEKSIALAEEKLNNKMQVKELARCDDENDFVIMIRVKVGNADWTDVVQEVGDRTWSQGLRLCSATSRRVTRTVAHSPAVAVAVDA